MKKTVAILYLLVMILTCTVGLAESANETRFDSWASSDSGLYTVLEIPTLYADYTPLAPHTAFEMITSSDEDYLTFFGMAWFNLLIYEIDELDKVANDTMAADIYRALKAGPAIACFTATAPNAAYVNMLCATSHNAWWLEWNLEEHTMKAMNTLGIERYAADDEFLSDYVFTSLLIGSVDGNIFSMTPIPDEAIIRSYGASSGVYSFLDAIFAQSSNGSPVPIE